MIDEQTELDIFTRLQRGERPDDVARATGVSRSLVFSLRKVGRPRFRAVSGHAPAPTVALIRWHCAIVQKGWTPQDRISRAVLTPANVEIPVFSMMELGFRPEWELDP